MKARLNATRIGGSLLLWILPAFAQAQPCLDNLQALLGGAQPPFLDTFSVSAVWALSGDGQTVVGESPDALNFYFLWSQAEGYVDFPIHFVTVTPSHNGKYMLGWTTGTSMVWDKSSGQVDTVSKPSGSTYGVPLAVTTGGAVLGTAYYGGSPYYERHVFRWTAAGGAHAVGSESLDLHDASASGSTLTGAMVGMSRANLVHWTSSSGQWEPLERPDDLWFSGKSRVSANGNYVAAWIQFDSDGDSLLDAFAIGRWSAGGSYSQLEVTQYSDLQMVDDEGTVYFNLGDVENWMTWKPGEGVKTAMEVLASHGVTDSVWALATVVGSYSASSDGRALATYGGVLRLEGGCSSRIRFDTQGLSGNWGVGSVIPLTVLVSGPLSDVDFYFSSDGVAWELVAADVPAPFGTAQYEWTVPDVNTDYGWLRAEAAAGIATLGAFQIQGTPGSCGEVTHTWTNAAGGGYETAGNWNAGSVPDTASYVTFEPNAPVNIGFGDAHAHSSLRVLKSQVEFDLNGQELLLLNPEGCVPAVHVKSAGVLTLTDGRLRSQGDIVLDGNQTAGLTVGSGAECRIDSGTGFAELKVGSGGFQGATLTVEAGGRFDNSHRSTFGHAFASKGHLIVSGDSSVFECRSLVLGAGGQGRATVMTLGTALADTVLIGVLDSGSVSVSTQGSVLSKHIAVGEGAAGHLTIAPDGFAQTDVLIVGSQGTVTGSVLYLGTPPPAARTIAASSAVGLTVVTLILSSGGALAVGSVALESGGLLGGDGLFGYDIVNSGVVSPGNSGSPVGVLRAGGLYTQTSSAAMEIDLGGLSSGTGHDALVVTGDAVLDGSLRLRLANGFQPQPGDEFEVLTAASVTGSFAVVVAPPGWQAQATYEAQTVRVRLDVASAVNHVEESGVRPAEYYLNQNYPNPFNPRTSIHFGLPQSSFVDLRVFNLLGREVAVLVHEDLKAGHHEVVFAPAKLPSGVYFYRLQAGLFDASRRLLLVK